jgi:hypothetical protein
LYGYLQDRYPEKLESLKKDKNWLNELNGKTESVSLPKYIRHSIHHPENTSNRPFTEKQLRKSIDLMRKLKYD